MADPAYIHSDNIKKVAEKIGEARYDGRSWYKYTREAYEFLLCFYEAMGMPLPDSLFTPSKMTQDETSTDDSKRLAIEAVRFPTDKMIEAMAFQIATRAPLSISPAKWEMMSEEGKGFWRDIAILAWGEGIAVALGEQHHQPA